MAARRKVSNSLLNRIKRGKVPLILKRFLYLFSFVLLVILFASGENGLLKVYNLHGKIKADKREIAALKAKAADLNWEIDKLKNDSAYIKLYASEIYGYAKADQAIIQFLPARNDSLK